MSLPFSPASSLAAMERFCFSECCYYIGLNIRFLKLYIYNVYVETHISYTNTRMTSDKDSLFLAPEQSL